MKKYIRIKLSLMMIVLCLFLFSIISPALNSIPKNNENISNKNDTNSLNLNGKDYDTLDQYNRLYNDDYEGIIKNHQSYSQSFIPRYPTLTRVKLLMFKNNYPNVNLHFYIFEDLDSLPIVHVIKSYNEIPNDFINAEWIELDFNDIDVNTSETYYIVLIASTESDKNFIWLKSDHNYYIDGSSWFYRDEFEYWMEINDEDMCFETYGMPNLDNSIIFGETLDLSESGEYAVCKAINIRRITFSPFNFNTYVSEEKIVIKKPFKGILAVGFVIAVSETCVYT